MVKWTEENKYQMMLAIIEHLNPTSIPWDKIANAVGPDFSSEAVRGQYKTLKKGFNLPNTTSTTTAAGPSSTSKSKTTKAKKTPLPTSSANGNGNGKGRKRKAAEASLNDDDDSSEPAPESSKKVKTEKETATGEAEVFKAEPNKEDEGIDLEHDALYSDDA